MLAHLQKVTTILLLVLAAVAALLLLSAGHLCLAVLTAFVILFGYSLVLAVEFAMMYAVSVSTAGRRLTARVLVRAWAIEAITTPRVFFWRQPFFSGRYPDALSKQPRQRGVVLVHGLFCNRGFWNPWLNRLRAERVPFVAVNLEPVFGSIDGYQAEIERAVAAMQSATGMPVILVGHSMGGLAIRAWLVARSAEDRVHHVFTIGSPHGGTWLARHSTAMNGRQMRIGSSWLARLTANEPAWHPDRMTCFYSDCDNIVFPMTCATLAGAENIHVAGLGHVRLAFEELIVDAVCRSAMSFPGAPEEEREADDQLPGSVDVKR